ncbi:MAG: hypothetical protein ABSE21_11925 [Bryobacteraceae bacterium]|jgi:hypothetical protein
MNDLKALSLNPSQVVYVYLAVWMLAALAHTMPTPDDKSSNGYRWSYNLMQFLLANLGNLQMGGVRKAE